MWQRFYLPLRMEGLKMSNQRYPNFIYVQVTSKTQVIIVHLATVALGRQVGGALDVNSEGDPQTGQFISS